MKTVLRVIALLLAAAVAAAGFFGYLPVPSVEQSAKLVENPYWQEYPEHTGYARDLLGDAERLLYDALSAAVDNGDAQVTVNNTSYSEESVRNVVTTLAFDRPDVFWIDFSNCYYLVDANGTVFSFTYKYSGADLAQRKVKFSRALEAAVSAIEAGNYTTQYDTAVAAHDWLALNCSYDRTLRQNDIHNAYGALVNNTAVCDGYAYAYSLILSRFGITCVTILGDGTDAAGTARHAWSRVTLDGVTTNVDVTWDDLDIEHGSDITLEGAVGHAYFGLSDEEIAANHEVDDLVSLPAEPGLADSWYARRGVQVTNQVDAVEAAAQQLVANLKDDLSYFEMRITVGEQVTRFTSDYTAGMEAILNRANELQKEAGLAKFKTNSSLSYFWLNQKIGALMVVCELAA